MGPKAMGVGHVESQENAGDSDSGAAKTYCHQMLHVVERGRCQQRLIKVTLRI